MAVVPLFPRELVGGEVVPQKLVGVYAHGAELPDVEVISGETETLLGEEDGAGRIQPDQDGDKGGKRENDRRDGEDKPQIEKSFDEYIGLMSRAFARLRG